MDGMGYPHHIWFDPDINRLPSTGDICADTVEVESGALAIVDR